jgi:hypothetical protein
MATGLGTTASREAALFCLADATRDDPVAYSAETSAEHSATPTAVSSTAPRAAITRTGTNMGSTNIFRPPILEIPPYPGPMIKRGNDLSVKKK